MWIKTGPDVISIPEGARIYRQVAVIRMKFLQPKDPGIWTVASYVNPDRAREVLEEFWQAVKDGRPGYEFPDL